MSLEDNKAKSYPTNQREQASFQPCLMHDWVTNCCRMILNECNTGIGILFTVLRGPSQLYHVYLCHNADSSPTLIENH